MRMPSGGERMEGGACVKTTSCKEGRLEGRIESSDLNTCRLAGQSLGKASASVS
jgi:hypothetical protein